MDFRDQKNNRKILSADVEKDSGERGKRDKGVRGDLSSVFDATFQMTRFPDIRPCDRPGLRIGLRARLG